MNIVLRLFAIGQGFGSALCWTLAGYNAQHPLQALALTLPWPLLALGGLGCFLGMVLCLVGVGIISQLELLVDFAKYRDPRTTARRTHPDAEERD